MYVSYNLIYAELNKQTNCEATALTARGVY